MDVYIYTEGIRKVKGEEELFLRPLAELEDFESVDAALEALVDEAPDLLGTEFVIFTQQPDYITVDEPTAKYDFRRRDGNSVAAEEPEDVVEPEDEEPEEEEAAPVATRRRPAAAKKPAAKKAGGRRRPAAKKKSGARAGTRVGSSKRTPFTRNPASVE